MNKKSHKVKQSWKLEIGCETIKPIIPISILANNLTKYQIFKWLSDNFFNL